MTPVLCVRHRAPNERNPEQIGGYVRTGRGPGPVTERDPIPGPLSTLSPTMRLSISVALTDWLRADQLFWRIPMRESRLSGQRSAPPAPRLPADKA